MRFFADYKSVVFHPVSSYFAKSTAKHPEFTLDENAPLLPPQMRLPTAVGLYTFGHRFASPELAQPGGRYRHYAHYGTDFAAVGSVFTVFQGSALARNWLAE